MWMTDLRHLLDDYGEIGPQKGSGRKIAEYFYTIVKQATTFDENEGLENIICRRRPGKKPCKGKIYALLNPETYNIHWRCPVCEDEGIIYNWEGTNWDMTES